VPERRQEVTTEGGLDVAGNLASTSDTRKRMNDAGIDVSLSSRRIEARLKPLRKTGSQFIELHTGAFAEAFPTSSTVIMNCNGLSQARARLTRLA